MGDDEVSVQVMEVPRFLRRAANNEKGFTLNFFEREVKRVEYSQKRVEQRKEEMQNKADKGGGDAGEEVSAAEKAAEEEL